MLSMSDHNFSGSPPPSWEGYRICVEGDESKLAEAIGHACDYRGDVTIHLKNGEKVIGYVFDRQEKNPQPYVKVFLANESEASTVKYQDISELEFSGEDTAFGRSWEDWAKKWQKPQVN